MWYLYYEIFLLKMFLVTGGWTGLYFLDSTEIYDPDHGSWRAGAALPSPLYGLRAASIASRILIFGIEILFLKKFSLICLITIVNTCMQVVLTEVVLWTVFWSTTSLVTPGHR